MANPKKSRFVVGLPLENNWSMLVAIFHTLTRSFLIITVELWELLQKDPSRIVEQAILQMLYDLGFLVDAAADETALLEDWKQRQLHNSWLMKFKNLVTRACNCACTYCFIKAVSVVMSLEMMRQVDRFCLNEIKEKRPAQVRAEYTGGECTTNIEVVYESSSRRFHYCEGKGIEYGFSVVSNMTLMTPAIVKRLKEVGLTHIRASVAGPQQVHDKLRPFRVGGPTYEIVMKNLQSVSGMVPIRIETQYDSKSQDSLLTLPQMMDDIARRGIEVESYNFAPIMAKEGRTTHEAEIDDPSIGLHLAREAERRGYPMFTEPSANGCSFDFSNNYVFDADGSLIPCAATDYGQMQIGNVERGIDFIARSQLIKRNQPDRCRNDCELSGGLCMGGCRLQALAAGNGFDGVNCRHDALLMHLHEYMKRKAEEALALDGANPVPNV